MSSTPDDLKPVVKYAFAGDNGHGTDPGKWATHIFDTEEKARSFGGKWKGRVVSVTVTPMAAERVDGEVDFYPDFEAEIRARKNERPDR